MALGDAILACLTERPMTGYELAKTFDSSIGFFWKTDHQQIYRELSRLREDIIKDPENVFTTTPQNVMKFVNFMTETGMVKSPAHSWKDLFTSLIADKPGG